MREGEPIDQFVANFRLLRLKLAQSGTVITEKDAVIRLLSALPSSYSSFVTSQNAILRLTQQMEDLANAEVTFLTVNEIVRARMQEEVSRTTQKAHGKNHALFTSKAGRRDFRQGGNKNPAHPGSSTPIGGSSSTPKRIGNCQCCQLPNHWEHDCRKKKSGEPRKPPPPEVNLTSKRDKPSPSVLLTQLVVE